MKIDQLLKFANELFPNATPLTILYILLFVFAFIWLFKEFRTQFKEERVEQHRRIDETIKVYSKCALYLWKYLYTLENPKEKPIIFYTDLMESMSEVFPFAERHIYRKLRQVLKKPEINSIRQAMESIEESIDHLKLKQGRLNAHNDSTISTKIEKYFSNLGKICFPFVSTLVFFLMLLCVRVISVANASDELSAIARLSSLIILFGISIQIYDLITLKKLALSKRSLFSVSFLLLAPIVVLIIPTWVSIAVSLCLIAIGLVFIQNKNQLERYQ